MNSALKQMIKGMVAAGSMDLVMNANHYGDWTPQRAVNIPFNVFLGSRIGKNGITTGRALGEIVGKDVLLGLAPSVYALPDTIKSLTKNTKTLADAAKNTTADNAMSNATKTLIGAGALATGIYGIHALKKELAKRRAEQRESTETHGKGTVQITLPTQDANDAETVVNMPLEEFSLAARLKAGIKRDVKRRLRAGIEERTQHKLAFNMLNGMGQLNVGIKPIGGIEMKQKEEEEALPPTQAPPPTPAPPTLTLSPVIKNMLTKAKQNIPTVQIKKAEIINPGQTALFGDTDRNTGLIKGFIDQGSTGYNRLQARRYNLPFDDAAWIKEPAPTELGQVPGYYGRKLWNNTTNVVTDAIESAHADTSSQLEHGINQARITSRAWDLLGDKFTGRRLGNALTQTGRSIVSPLRVGYGALSDTLNVFTGGMLRLPGARAKPQDYAVHRLNVLRDQAKYRAENRPRLGLSLGHKPKTPVVKTPTVKTPEVFNKPKSSPVRTLNTYENYRGGM